VADAPVLDVRQLSVAARSQSGTATILDGVDLTVGRGQVVGLVGESGSGKSTLASSIVGILGPNRDITGGTIRFEDDLAYSDGVDNRRLLRGKRIGYVFQSTSSSLNPMRRVGSQLGELVRLHGGLRGAPARRRMDELLETLGFSDPGRVKRAYPHQLSGGMAQRVSIAMALVGNPALLIADECTSALDVRTQDAVVRLLRTLSDESGYAMIFVTHDIALAADVCDTLAVLKDGAVVENGPIEQVVRAPRADYTKQLIDAVPVLGPRRRATTDGGAEKVDETPVDVLGT
jgi:peptide/nickel transport system ATP-binding protein